MNPFSRRSIKRKIWKDIHEGKPPFEFKGWWLYGLVLVGVAVLVSILGH